MQAEITLRQAAQQALEALESGDWYIDQLEMLVYLADDTGTHEERAKVQAAITALRAALAEPEQEPVAWVDLVNEAQAIVESKPTYKRFIDGTPLSNDIAVWMADFAEANATPTPRKPLTEREIQLIWAKTFEMGSSANTFARAIERAHGIGEQT